MAIEEPEKVGGRAPGKPGRRAPGEGSSSEADASLAWSEGEVGALEGQPIGAYLRQQRELRGISRSELATRTRIPLRSLERLESGFFDDNVDGFVRGFVRTVAEALGLDPDDTISRMLSEPGRDSLTPSAAGYLVPATLLGLGMLALIGLTIGLVRFGASRDAAATPTTAASETTLRRDPVRALAEAVAASREEAPEVPPVSSAPE